MSNFEYLFIYVPIKIILQKEKVLNFYATYYIFFVNTKISIQFCFIKQIDPRKSCLL